MVGAPTGHAGCHHVAIADRLDFLHVDLSTRSSKYEKISLSKSTSSLGDIFSDIGVKSTNIGKENACAVEVIGDRA